MTAETAPAAAQAEQRAAALQLGNQVRYQRADFKRQLKEQTMRQAIASVAEFLEAPPEYAATWPLGKLLRAIPRIRKQKLGRILMAASCSELRSIGALTDRQRIALVAELRQAAEQD